MDKKPNEDIIRSSAAEYLTFISATGESGVEVIYADENIWLSQKMMATLDEVEPNTINYHLKKIFSDSELDENSVIRKFRITANDGKSYETLHYNLSAIIAVGYKVNSERAVQFRKWATQIVQEFTIKGFAMDDERLKNDGSILGKKYFEEQLQRLVSAYLDIAEDMATRQIPMTMQDWETRLNRFIDATDRKVLQDVGKVTAEIAKAHAETEFEKYRIIQDRLFESDFDRLIKNLPPTNKEDKP
jgi:hypothetical protein